MAETENEGDMRTRLDKLSRDIGAQTPKTGETNGPPKGPGNLGAAMSMGFRVMAEFVAAVVVSALIGWQADRWLGTSPGLLILFVALGTAAGFYTVYRTATAPTGLPGKR